jgi:ADP-heptose:LPS heptosyltransferase
LYDLLTTASVFIGNDSGPGHLAAISGVPTITLFGGDPTTWKPLGPRVKVVAKPTISEIAVDEVLNQI